MYISEIRTKAPADERMPLERKFYDTLEKLKIPYEQVDNDPASSMEECGSRQGDRNGDTEECVPM